MRNELFIEAVELGDIEMLEEEIVPCTGCGCECTQAPPVPSTPGTGGGGGSCLVECGGEI